MLEEAALNIRIETDDDTVFCPFCFKHLSEFDTDDNAFQEHKEHKPSCIFIKQVSGPRARTSLWNDPFNVKGKQKFTIQEIQKMKNAISKAHWNYIEQTQKEALQNPEIQACELNVLNQFNKKNKGKNRGKAQMLKSALKKVNFSTKKNYCGDFMIFETPADEVLPKRPNNPLETFGQQMLVAVELRSHLGNSTSKRKSEYRKSSLKNLHQSEHRKGQELSRMEDKENTPLTTPVSLDSTMNKTISIPLASKITEDLVDLQGYKMSPGTPQIGKDKILYVRDGSDRLIPLPIKIDKNNINNFKRV